MTVYLISGLGADRRLFERLELPAGFRAVHLDWIPPHPLESLPQYALRLAAPINQGEPFVLAGLSMGGMIATEIAKVVQPQKTILLSSTTSVRGLPGFVRALGTLQLDRLLPASWIRAPEWFAFRLQGATDPASRQLVRNLMRDADKAFSAWARRAVLEWRNNTVPPGIVRIHGSADKVIPLDRKATDHVVDGAGHMMVYTHAGEVSEILGNIF